MKNKKLVAGLVLATMVLTGKYLHDQAFVGVEKKVTIKNSKIKTDLKITHISDLHSNAISNLDEILGKIATFNPDLIFLTGDMIDYPT
ncbi:metallophosphoesterase, partial [uncultured Anaerococcus sp.]|uniref:metallophosphoesterase n=1 Tax=uncultured Anaerococcus sp. TaxID=293428 RepID=UPI002889E72C